jgi:hypothetical protein
MQIQKMEGKCLLYTSSSYSRLWIYLPSFIRAYVLHIFYFIFILFYTYTKLHILTHCEVEGLPLSESRVSTFMLFSGT